jgi:hypothetical protein
MFKLAALTAALMAVSALSGVSIRAASRDRGVAADAWHRRAIENLGLPVIGAPVPDWYLLSAEDVTGSARVKSYRIQYRNYQHGEENQVISIFERGPWFNPPQACVDRYGQASSQHTCGQTAPDQWANDAGDTIVAIDNVLVVVDSGRTTATFANALTKRSLDQLVEDLKAARTFQLTLRH